MLGCVGVLVTGLDYGRGVTETIQGRAYDDESYNVVMLAAVGGEWHHPQDCPYR